MAQKPKVDPHVGRLGYLQALVTEFQETESEDAKEQVLANLANFAYDPSNYQYLRQLQVLDLFLDSLSEENETLVEFAIEESVSTIELAEPRGKGISDPFQKARLRQAGKPFWNLEGEGWRPEWTLDLLSLGHLSQAWALPWDSVSRQELGGGPGLRPPNSPCSSPGGLCNLCSDKANKEHILQTGGVPLIINCLSSPNEETVLSAVTTIMYLSSPGSGSHPELTAMPVVQCMLRFSLSANTRLRNLAQIFLEDFCSPSQVAEARSWRAHSALGIPLPKTEAPQQP
ncbi:armadillo repeat-containing protein 7 isoform X1 [Equus caballus]|uniref:armadillo repeat-containing protein 7 isoform X1 n=1 Tax=Equus caballus TaxID=9796 RepID=UPI000C9E3B67|nr:armadillo repeat-containing protein 7 isoform X1 [Equus caballus]